MTSTHKIIIVKSEDRHTSYDDYDRVIGSISDWYEVTSEELQLLKKYIHTINYDYQIIEHINNTQIPIIISDLLEKAIAEDKKKQAAIEKRKKDQARKAAEKKYKAEEDEKKLLEELKKKYE